MIKARRDKLIQQRKPAKPRVPYRSMKVDGLLYKGRLMVDSEDIKRIKNSMDLIPFWM